MSAYDFEYELAQRDGATFYFNVTPIELLGDERGQVCAVKFVRTETNNNGEWSLIPGSEFSEPADMVLKAVGQSKQSAWLRDNFPVVRLDERGVSNATRRQVKHPWHTCLRAATARTAAGKLSMRWVKGRKLLVGSTLFSGNRKYRWRGNHHV
jgi:NADPH-dependent glutamate synthase beta subunit-like oxidoreductase